MSIKYLVHEIMPMALPASTTYLALTTQAHAGDLKSFSNFIKIHDEYNETRRVREGI